MTCKTGQSIIVVYLFVAASSLATPGITLATVDRESDYTSQQGGMQSGAGGKLCNLLWTGR